MLNEIVKHLQKRGIEVYLCEANPQVRRHMYRAGLFRTLGRKHLWRKFSTALEKCEADLAEKINTKKNNIIKSSIDFYSIELFYL